MTWLLVIVMTYGGPLDETRAGYLATEGLCSLAGATMSRAIADANPGLRVGWRCRQEGGA